MQLPLTEPETLFEELWQDLPPATAQMARECKAFVRAKKIKTPAQLLRVVFFSCGVDKSLREVAGPLTALYETSTDQAVAERWRACGPWGQALLRRMLPLAQGDTLPAGRRLVVIDASSMQAPGAHTGETLQHFTLAPGDVAVADRGYAQCPGRQAAVAQGADLIVRLHPFRVVLGDAAGVP